MKKLAAFLLCILALNITLVSCKNKDKSKEKSTVKIESQTNDNVLGTWISVSTGVETREDKKHNYTDTETIILDANGVFSVNFTHTSDTGTPPDEYSVSGNYVLKGNHITVNFKNKENTVTPPTVESTYIVNDNTLRLTSVSDNGEGPETVVYTRE